MSAALFSRNLDLQKLREAGYLVRVEGGNLVLRDVPYVTVQREVKFGVIRCALCLAGDVTQKPDNHTVYFDGGFPCQSDGTPLQRIAAGNQLPHNLLQSGSHYLSSKPDHQQGYADYFEKMSTYATIISGPAAQIQPDASPRKVFAVEPDEESVFLYVETASDRAGIGALTKLLEHERVAIVGVGGTGSYVLDLVAKTPIEEIRLFDGDDFLQHNAFRAPGAAALAELQEVPKKVDYFAGIYSRMRRGIAAHAVELNQSNAHLLDGITFAFLCMDDGAAKRTAVERLEQLGVPFIDVGMGLELSAGTLGGILRVTLSEPEHREFARKRIAFEGPNAGDAYRSNIQIAELNALNASLAVIRWKKFRGFYRDLDREAHCSYTTDGNMLVNEVRE